MLQHPVLRPRSLLIYGSAAMLAGVMISILMSGGRARDLRQIGAGAMIGLTCFVFAIVLEVVLHRWFGRLTDTWQYLARAIVFMGAGVCGFYVGIVGASLLFYGQMPPTAITRLKLPILIAVGVGTALGLSFFTFERLRERLRESVKRAVRSEYAEKELELARAIQQRLLPAAETEGDGYRISARNLAARWVAGDFYDIFALPGGAVGVAVADVAGKGMGASLIMASAKSVLPLLAATRRVEATLEELGAKLRRELGQREFVAVAYARFEPATGKLQLANGGLPDPYLLRPGCDPMAISVPGPRLPLGIRNSVGYESVEITLAPGDRLLLFSDGLPEAPGPSGEPLGYEELPRLVALPAAGPEPWIDQLIGRIRAASTAELEDDWTVVVIERTA